MTVNLTYMTFNDSVSCFTLDCIML